MVLMAIVTKRKWVRWLILGAGSLCVSLSVPPLTPLLAWERAVGTIKLSPSRGEVQPSPDVTYRQADGSLWGLSPSANELPRHYRPGDTVTVLHCWKDAVVLSTRLWAWPAAIGVFGVFLVAIGLFSSRSSSLPPAANAQPLQTPAA
jgi:hypothetical protein